MDIPPDPKHQCKCQHCHLDKHSPFGAADSLLHIGTQANYRNYIHPDLPGADTPDAVRGNLIYIIDRYLNSCSKNDWENLLQYYDHVNFDIRITGAQKPKSCTCDTNILVTKGCQCDGF